MSDGFAVHLGGGAYLDSFGNIVFGPPSGAQIYQKPAGLLLDTKKLREAFKDLSGILPINEADKKNWEEWGVPTNIVNFLNKIVGPAGIFTSVFTTYVWAIGVLVSIMGILSADDGLSPELGKALNSIKNKFQGQEQINRANQMIALHGEFNGRIDRIKSLLLPLHVQNIAGADRLQVFSKMQAILDELAVPLSNLRDQEWATTYDADNYKGRAFAAVLLVFVRPDGSLAPVPMQAPNVTVFDYRLGVPMLLFGAATFASLAQIAMPWHRSAGVYSGQLRQTADALDRFVLRMQDECLARTEYTPTTVAQQRMWSIFEMPGGVGGPTGFGGFVPTYAVGAFDLVRYNDAFLSERFGALFQAGQNTGPRGLFNYHWYTPATDEDDVADAANEQARQDYANLQTATGMFHLVSTAAWLRFLSTPPRESETVRGSANASRFFHNEAATTATSPSIHPVGVITHPATLKRYVARNRILVTTQEPGYTPPFRYRIVLRTINALFGNEGWTDRNYVGDVWQADYEPTQADPRVKRLKTNLIENFILNHEVELYAGPSPTQPVSRNGEARIDATTFDWYVPVVSPWSPYADTIKDRWSTVVGSGGIGGEEKTMLATGGVSIHLMGQNALPGPVHVLSDPGPLTAAVIDDALDLGDLLGLHDVSLDKAERRHVKIEEVEIKWELNWTADKLEIRLFGRPDYRPFQVHVVVEEAVYSGETLPDNPGDIIANEQLREYIHTPFIAEMLNQLVFVPEEFFDEERKAIVEAAKMWREFMRRFAELAPIGPGDPIEFLNESIREMAKVSPSTSTLAATMDKRVEFAMSQAPELWNAVVRETTFI